MNIDVYTANVANFSCEICAVGVPMSAVPGQSQLWTLAEDDDSRVLTWENFFLGGDTNSPVNAQIRLFANGDFTTRSNDVETVCRRVNPDDWDGDGLANEKDENPLAYDGDFFGAANAMPTNANLDAYYQLDVAAAGALDFATIRVTCDGPSDLGDHVVIARTNQVCHVPLLVGATYAVYVNNWHIHGARSSFGNNVFDLGSAGTPLPTNCSAGTPRPTSWSFPLGTNGAAFSSFRYRPSRCFSGAGAWAFLHTPTSIRMNLWCPLVSGEDFCYHMFIHEKGMDI